MYLIDSAGYAAVCPASRTAARQLFKEGINQGRNRVKSVEVCTSNVGRKIRGLIATIDS